MKRTFKRDGVDPVFILMALVLVCGVFTAIWL